MEALNHVHKKTAPSQVEPTTLRGKNTRHSLATMQPHPTKPAPSPMLIFHTQHTTRGERSGKPYWNNFLIAMAHPAADLNSKSIGFEAPDIDPDAPLLVRSS